MASEHVKSARLILKVPQNIKMKLKKIVIAYS